VKERRLDRGQVEAELGQDPGRSDGMRDVRLASGPPLAVMGKDRKVERSLDGLEVGAWVGGKDRRVEVGAQGIEIDAA
jgi:hypothetical protein